MKNIKVLVFKFCPMAWHLIYQSKFNVTCASRSKPGSWSFPYLCVAENLIVEIMRLVIKFCLTVAFKIDLDLWLKVKDTSWDHGHLLCLTIYKAVTGFSLSCSFASSDQGGVVIATLDDLQSESW